MITNCGLVEKIIQSSLIGVVEVFVSHPIEYIKTQYQSTNSLSKLHYDSRIFVNSMYPRLATIIPMRTLFWSSVYWHKQNKSSVMFCSSTTSFIQTIIDFPSDQIKSRQICMPKTQTIAGTVNMLNYMRGNYIFHGYFTHNCRNFIFLYNYYLFKNKKDDFIHNAFGSLCGVFLSHPFDTIKTLYHCENDEMLKKYIYKPNIRDYNVLKTTKFLMNGVLMRASNTTMAMVLGWFMMNYVF